MAGLKDFYISSLFQGVDFAAEMYFHLDNIGQFKKLEELPRTGDGRRYRVTLN